uniref:Plasmid pARN4 n=1 Tax=Saccharolobus islandicus TaxID=43080 RepID=R7RB09_SACIS|nr:Ig-like domain repeat protein [Sulfolobus islandicus]CDF47299.1 unnamed protein product [Sulfolobus islandicus]
MRKALTILLIILVLPSLLGGVSNLVVLAAGGGGGGSNSLGQFISTLQTAIPAALILLAILANRYDQRYALVLFAAALASAIFLAAATGGGGVGGAVNVTLVQLQVKVTGPTSVYVGDTETYSVSWTPPIKGTIIWTIIYNGTIVYNATGGTNLAYTFNEPGNYIIMASVVNQQNFAGGSGAVFVTVTNPPSPLGWLVGTITNAIKSFINSAINSIEGFITSVLQFAGAPLEWMTYSPTPYFSTSTPNASPFIETMYNEMKDFSIGLAMLFIAFSIAYNAIRGAYADIVDLAGDVIYKLSVWGLFFAGGLTIYTYAANFINSIIYYVAGPFLGLATTEFTLGSVTIVSLFGADNLIPFGLGDPLSMFLALSTFLLALSLAIAMIKYAVMMAIVVTIPLWATLWIFEWTRKIAVAVVDFLIGLMVAGLVAAMTFAILATTPLGALTFILDPIAMDGEFLFTAAFFVFGLKPGEHVFGSFRSRQQSQQQQQQVVVVEQREVETSSPPPGRYM